MDTAVQLITNGLIAGSLYALVALGFNLMYATARFFNIALGVMIPLGGYAVFWLTKYAHAPLWIAVIGGVVCAGLCGALFDAAFFSPLRRRKASSLVLIIASLGLYTVVQAILAIVFSSQLQTIAVPDFFRQVLSIGGASLTGIQLSIIACAALVSLVFFCVVHATPFGRAVRAVSDDREMASTVGIHTERITTIVFGCASAIGGLVGILVGLDVGIEPTMGMFYFLSGVIGSIVGGIGQIIPGFFGSLLEGFVENVGIWKIPAEWKNAIAFVLLIGVLFVRPQGIFKR